MKKRLLRVLLLTCGAALAQQPPEAPKFEVASIKAVPQGAGPMAVRISMSVDNAMLRYTSVPLRDCIRVAYGVKDFQIQGPDWLARERFDIVAKLPEGATQDQVPEMLQNLLAERFMLKVRREPKEHSVYALVPGRRGPKLTPAENPVEEGGGRTPGAPRGRMMMMMGPEGARLRAPSATITGFAEILSRFSERPIIDMTGLEGQYDFDVMLAPEVLRNAPGMGMRGPMGGPPPGGGMRGGPGAQQPGGGPGPGAIAGEPSMERAGSIEDAVQRYGLRLESRKLPMEVLVVEHIEQTPTEN